MSEPNAAMPEPNAAMPEPKAPIGEPILAGGEPNAPVESMSDAERIAEDILGQERAEIANTAAAGVELDVSPAMAAAMAATTTFSPEELVAQAANAPVPTAEEIASLAAATAVAIPHAAGPVVEPPDETTEGAAVADAPKARPIHRARLRGWTVKFVTFVLTLALFVGGVALGGAIYQRTQPPPPVVGDSSTGGVPTPPVVKELVDALASNDADSLRSAVSGDPYRLLAGELQSWNMQGVTSVKTLATMQDGPRSATEIIITGKSANGDPLVFNLVVHVTDNQIVNFR